jgi:MFS family permease
MNGAEPVRTAAGTPFDPKAARAVLAILAGMALMVTYVETMVLPSFGAFETFFNEPPATTVAWIISAYLLVGTVATPIFGKLGDKYGKKRMLLVVMGIYALAVSVAGFSPNLGAAFGLSRANQIYVLIGVRAVQGLGMAMFPLAFAMIPEVFPARRVGQAQGVVSAMFAGGAALGLAGGGWVAATYGWQLTYHTIIPVAVLLPILSVYLIRESPHRVPHPIDFPGVTSLGLALAFLMLGITEGTAWGWTSFTAGSIGGVAFGVPEFFLLAAAATVFFLWWEPRARFPVVSFRALRERNIWVSNVNGVIVGLVMFVTFVGTTVLAEDQFAPGFNLSPFQYGLVALPAALGMLAFGLPIGRTVGRLGPKPVMLIGFTAIGLGTAALAFFHGTVLDVLLLMIPILVGNVAVLIAMSNVIVLTANPRDLGIQTGMNQTFRNLGSAVGPVLVTSIVATWVRTVYVPVAPPPAPLHPVGVPAEFGFVVLFALTAAASLIGFFLTLALRNFRFTETGVRAEAGRPLAGGSPSAAPDESSVPVVADA